MAAFLSIHGIRHLVADTVQHGDDCAGHFTLNFEGEAFDNRGAVTFYMKDRTLNERLIDAINSTIAARKAELSAAGITPHPDTAVSP